jgi:hypothetical protein
MADRSTRLARRARRGARAGDAAELYRTADVVSLIDDAQWRRAMAQVVTRCRLTGHYMFMGMDVDAEEFTRAPGPFTRKFCPFCACDHLWHREDSTLPAPGRPPRPSFQQAS